ncbi:hypothetical protein NOR_07079 [Metarhizium rileyi]|uniref:Uncharacterized protein n=1 Tax=Metarhizium rileyi (strain RCEF 4871) TaxID=1649241 RepID=A0A166YZ50_METRR|nr:hypothetical protein NOR_07079 [Metarhizium rileyi RCEF 4871]
MDVEQMLDIPQGEIAFLYPNDAPVDRFDRRFTTLRVPRRGLREWSSFEEDPAFIQKFMKLSTGYPTDWKPSVCLWTRYIAIIGAAKHFNSYGTDDNRMEGAPEVHIGPDLTVFDGDIANPPDLQQLQEYLLTIGDAKVKHLAHSRSQSKLLPGTVGCYESWLAQAVQGCIDLDISIGWVQTNLEVVIFHLSRYDDNASQDYTVTTRSSRTSSSTLEALLSETSQEPDYSSPLVRQTHDWLNFKDGDEEIPLLTSNDIVEQQWATPTHSPNKRFQSPTTPRHLATLTSSPLGRKGLRDVNPQEPSSSQYQRQNYCLPPLPAEPRTTLDDSSDGDYPLSSSQLGTVSTANYDADPRADDVSHVLIRSIPLTDKKVGKWLLTLVMLAKRVKENNALGIGPWKLSHSALDDLEASSMPH